MRELVRRARWLRCQASELLGLLLCLLLVVLLMPLVPVMRAYERARRLFEGDD